jgi:arylsulfatase
MKTALTKPAPALESARRVTSHVLCYGMMDDVFRFAATFKEFPPRSFPPSFNPATVLKDTLRGIKAERKLKAAFPRLRGETSE